MKLLLFVKACMSSSLGSGAGGGVLLRTVMDTFDQIHRLVDSSSFIKEVSKFQVSNLLQSDLSPSRHSLPSVSWMILSLPLLTSDLNPFTLPPVVQQGPGSLQP